MRSIELRNGFKCNQPLVVAWGRATARHTNSRANFIWGMRIFCLWYLTQTSQKTRWLEQVLLCEWVKSESNYCVSGQSRVVASGPIQIPSFVRSFVRLCISLLANRSWAPVLKVFHRLPVLARPQRPLVNKWLVSAALSIINHHVLLPTALVWAPKSSSRPSS